LCCVRCSAVPCPHLAAGCHGVCPNASKQKPIYRKNSNKHILALHRGCDCKHKSSMRIQEVFKDDDDDDASASALSASAADSYRMSDDQSAAAAHQQQQLTADAPLGNGDDSKRPQQLQQHHYPVKRRSSESSQQSSGSMRTEEGKDGGHAGGSSSSSSGGVEGQAEAPPATPTIKVAGAWRERLVDFISHSYHCARLIHHSRTQRPHRREMRGGGRC
jgi:hypothetical protein